MDKLINKYSKDKNLNEIKLHLGCGHRKFSNWINIDNYEFEQGDTSRKCCNADLMLDITKLNEYVEENTVSEIMLVHVLEHFTRWIAIDLFKIFYSVLKKDGLLIMEHPDLDGCIDLYKKSNRTLSTPIG
jgi:predicted SAM-dependent methyltransferase